MLRTTGPCKTLLRLTRVFLLIPTTMVSATITKDQVFITAEAVARARVSAVHKCLHTGEDWLPDRAGVWDGLPAEEEEASVRAKVVDWLREEDSTAIRTKTGYVILSSKTAPQSLLQ